MEHLLSNDGIVDEDWLEDARSSRSIEKLPEQVTASIHLTKTAFDQSSPSYLFKSLTLPELQLH